MSDAQLERAAGDEAPQPEPASLLALRSPLADPAAQRAHLEQLELDDTMSGGCFERAVAGASGGDELRAGALEIVQINLGRLCNMSCRHCHVDAGPARGHQVMSRETVDDCLAFLDASGAQTVDLTGGAPELSPHFRFLVDACARRGKHVIDRCNLTVLLMRRNQDLPEWLAERRVEVVGSLPHFRRRSTDGQRGAGAFERSIEGLGRLNRAGYGLGDPHRVLTLVVNPVGAFLAGSQRAMEREWKQMLQREQGVSFDRLITITNMPIARYLDWLEVSGNLRRYMDLLISSFNPATLEGLMCRSTLSVSSDGRVFDCDFNQMLELEARPTGGRVAHIRDLDPASLQGRRLVTARHCFGCTAGSGSSCGGALDP